MGWKVTTQPATEIFTLDQAKRRRAAMLATLHEVTRKLAIGISGVATETAQFIFNTTLAPKLNYGLELVSPNAYRATILDNPQITFTYLMLSQPTAKRSELLQAEVGDGSYKIHSSQENNNNAAPLPRIAGRPINPPHQKQRTQPHGLQQQTKNSPRTPRRDAARNNSV